MDKFQNKYRIPSARASWHGYDGGIYYVTICTKNMEYYFGDIDDVPQMNLTEIGKYATEIYEKANDFYPYAEIPLFVVMPNHIHAIIFIDADDSSTASTDAINHDSINFGTASRDAINRVSSPGNENKKEKDAMNRVSTTTADENKKQPGGITGEHNPMLNQSLGTVIRGLNARITRYANKNNLPFAWQSRFHDRIVRDQNELNRIADYIENNIANWYLDKYNQ